MNFREIKRLCVCFLAVGILFGAIACKDDMVASFTAEPMIGVPPIEVLFDASKSSPRDADLYEWDFGDGSQGEGVIIYHTYTQSGEYDVRLVVHDNADTDSKVKRVSCSAGPEATFIATPSTGDAPLPVSFNGIETTPLARPRFAFNFGGQGKEQYVIETLVWDYGDGTTETWENNLTYNVFGQVIGQSLPLLQDHTCAVPGTYTVTLTVTDVFGLTDLAERQIVVGSAEPDLEPWLEPEPDPGPEPDDGPAVRTSPLSTASGMAGTRGR